MSQSLWLRLALVVAISIASACTPPPAETSYAALEPAPPQLKRLTRAQYLTTLGDLLGEGLALPTSIEPDLSVEGLLSLGASISTLSKRGVEQYDDAARSLARQMTESPQRLVALLPCATTGTKDEACLKSLVTDFGRRAWRRPLTDAETSGLLTIGLDAQQTLGTFEHGVEFILMDLLQSPYFLYRSELGNAQQGLVEGSHLKGYDLASKLSYFLWNGPPDQTLLNAARDGLLDDKAGLQTQVARMMDDPKLERAVRAFFSEWLHLNELDGLNKDPNIFKHFSADLGKMAREETLRLATWVTLEQDADIGLLLTARKTWVTRRLAALYNIKVPPQDGFIEVDIPDDSPRQGFLGQVSFLGLNSHPVSSSATLRGIFVRTALLCDFVAPPPAGVNTSLPEPDPEAKTLRERLEVHMNAPACKGCHAYIDPIGFGIENFDGVGRWRLTDNDAPIDASGELDGEKFKDFRGLTYLIANSEKFSRCVPEKLITFALGHHDVDGEKGAIDRLTDRFISKGRRIKSLMRDIALSDLFGRVGAIEGGQP